MKDKRIIGLGIETTAHTFGVGIVDSKGNVLANEKKTFTTELVGMHPRVVAEHHMKIFDTILLNALKKANIQLNDLSYISVSYGPGIGSILRIGMIVAKMIALKKKIPLVLVNHCISHLEIGKITTPTKDPVLLYVSGANTQIIAFDNGAYRVFGETLDMGVGTFIDNFARYIKLGFPGGPKIEKLAKTIKGGSENMDNFIELPYVVKGMDISLGGLLTNLKQKFDKGFKKNKLAYSLQETVFAMLIETSERALAHCEKKELLLGGGVSCNKRLQEMAKNMCENNGYKFFCPANEFLMDNGAMIAWNGMIKYLKKDYIKVDDIYKVDIKPYIRTDRE